MRMPRATSAAVAARKDVISARLSIAHDGHTYIPRRLGFCSIVMDGWMDDMTMKALQLDYTHAIRF